MRPGNRARTGDAGRETFKEVTGVTDLVGADEHHMPTDRPEHVAVRDWAWGKSLLE